LSNVEGTDYCCLVVSIRTFERKRTLYANTVGDGMRQYPFAYAGPMGKTAKRRPKGLGPGERVTRIEKVLKNKIGKNI
jgi:hypothetical protein